MKLLLTISIMLLVLPVGAKTDAANLLTCMRRPSELLRIILAMFIAVPVLAIVLVEISSAPRPMKGALLLMAISAAAPFLPKKLFTLGVSEGFVESMSFVTTILAIPLVPMAVQVLGSVFSEDLSISATAVTRPLAVTFLIPLAVGMALKAWLGPSAARIGELLGTIGIAVLGLLVVLMLITQGATIFSLLWSALPLVVLFAAGSLAIGHLLGGPIPRRERPSQSRRSRGIRGSRF
jgi:BASS family bile acid:Na+ symporter